jgi:transcriptional regulator with AAA-type ATPase domain
MKGVACHVKTNSLVAVVIASPQLMDPIRQVAALPPDMVAVLIIFSLHRDLIWKVIIHIIPV